MSVCLAAAVSLVFSFTNGAEWDGPYTLKFRVPKPWQNKPLSFFNEVTNLIRLVLHFNLIPLMRASIERRGSRRAGDFVWC